MTWDDVFADLATLQDECSAMADELAHIPHVSADETESLISAALTWADILEG